MKLASIMEPHTERHDRVRWLAVPHKGQAAERGRIKKVGPRSTESLSFGSFAPCERFERARTSVISDVREVLCGEPAGLPSHEEEVPNLLRERVLLELRRREEETAISALVGAWLAGIAPLLEAWDGQLRRLSELKEDWDGQGARPVPPELITDVRKHLLAFAAAFSVDRQREHAPEPWIAVSTDGAVGVEWQFGPRRLAVTFEAPNEACFFAEDDSGRELADDYPADLPATLAVWLLMGTGLPFGK